jgi:uncharacterized membrane protein YbhN (UPF0104 family)
MLAIFAPGGIGVKEGIGIMLLSQLTSLETAFLAVVTMRIISVVVELCNGLIGVLFIHIKEARV